MSESEQPAVIAQGPHGTLREMQQYLSKHGIGAQIVRPPEEQGSG